MQTLVFCIIFTIWPCQECWLEKDSLWCQQFCRLCASNKLYNLCCAYFPLPPPTSVAVKKLHVVRALGFCSRLIFPSFEKLKAHWLQPANSRSAISQQPVAMVTPGSVEGRYSSSEYMIQPPSTKHQRVLCCCHHKPAWCLLLAPPTATEIFSLPGIVRWKRQKRLVCAYVRVGNFANGTVFTPADHLQPNFSSLRHLYLWAVSPDGFQQEGSNDVVNVSLQGWIQILRERKESDGGGDGGDNADVWNGEWSGKGQNEESSQKKHWKAFNDRRVPFNTLSFLKFLVT